MEEQQIREAAYRLWEKEGKPQGQDLEHWFTAEKSVDVGYDSSTSDSKIGNENAPSQADFAAEPENENNDGR